MAETVNSLKKCSMCGETKNIIRFYNSYSVLFQKAEGHKMCVCKDCILDLYASYLELYNDDKKAVYKVCELLDIYFCNSLFEAAKIQSNTSKNKNSVIISIYMQKVNSMSQYKNKTSKDSEILGGDKDTNININTTEHHTEDVNVTSDFVITTDMTNFWGKGYLNDEYEYLEYEYYRLINSYECDNYATELLFQEIAQTRLTIKKKREKRENVDKESKTLQDFLSSADIKPSDKNKSNATEQESFGTLVKKYENERPTPEPSPEWKDVDGIKKYITVWFLGHLCKMLGIKNEDSLMYDEETRKYTVDVPDFSNAEEDEDIDTELGDENEQI